jgi:drug/metabolite transporter (DMT)-like permease
LGFIGVVIVLNPTEIISHGITGDHAIGVMIGLTGAVATASISIALRDLGRTESPTTIVFYFSALSMIPLGLALPFVFTPHTAE